MAPAGLAYIEAMIRDWARVEELERRYQREALRDVDYPEALRRFAALWAEALLVNPDIGADWEDDLKSDLAVARAINGLPPRA